MNTQALLQQILAEVRALSNQVAIAGLTSLTNQLAALNSSLASLPASIAEAVKVELNAQEGS